MARWADRASSLVVLLVALASAALADGDQLASVQLISTPEQLATLITQHQLPMKITNEAEAQAAMAWVRDALVDAKAYELEGKWHKGRQQL